MAPLPLPAASKEGQGVAAAAAAGEPEQLPPQLLPLPPVMSSDGLLK
jgi:hypothetical protein